MNKDFPKILISIPWFSPAYKAGGPIQSVLNLVKNYNRSAYFIIAGTKEADGSLLETGGFNSWKIFNGNTQVLYTEKPISVITNAVRKFKPEILFIIGLFDFKFNVLPLFFSKGPVKILSVRGMLHPGALSQKSLKKRVFIFLMKMSGIHKRVYFHATDEAERKYIFDAFGKSARVMVAQNFPHLVSPKRNFDKVSGKLRLATIALISPMKNHSLVLDALGSCKEEIIYSIYGPVKDNAYWEECIRKINALPPNIIVRYEGELQPGNIEEALQKSDVFIMPSKSENYGHAIIEALSAGLPVITSHHTPWQNLQENRAGINAGENAAELVEAISYFAAMEPVTFKEWSVAATAYALERTEMEAIKAQCEALFSVAR